MQNSKQKILVVDDNPKNIQVLASFLYEKGYEIEYSQSGPDALEWIKTESFDLILLDIMMPEMDGFEVCQIIKSNPKNKDLPIIFLTAKTDIESINKAFNAGGVDYISKPFNSDELIARVNTHLDLKHSKDSLRHINNKLEDLVQERTKQLKVSLEKLAIAKTELELLDKTKTEFMLLLSHEIRTPLNGILGGVELLKEADLPDETLVLLNILDVSTKRLEAFSMKTLEISQLRTKGKGILRPERINISSIIHYQQERLKNTIKEKKLEINSINLTHAWLHADMQYLNMAFTQILDNAAFYSLKNGCIRVEVNTNAHHLVCTVYDQGIGFSKELIGKPIKSFHGDFQDIDKKTGLGLYLANLIVDTHDGLLSFGNNKTGGAFVRLELPIKTSAH
jgi:two-component system sensor histidine kinase/response regulator